MSTAVNSKRIQLNYGLCTVFSEKKKKKYIQKFADKGVVEIKILEFKEKYIR